MRREPHVRFCERAAVRSRRATHLVVCFEHRVEAERFRQALADRFARFGLRVSAEKTRQIEFGKWAGHNGTKGPTAEPRTFQFLGFTHYMRKRSRGYRTARKPSPTSRNRFLRSVKDWLDRHRDHPVRLQAQILRRKLQGYYTYFSLRYCLPALRHIRWHVGRLWITALRNRSQRHRLPWRRVVRLPWFRWLPEPTLR